jgi:hypothetical protein
VVRHPEGDVRQFLEKVVSVEGLVELSGDIDPTLSNWDELVKWYLPRTSVNPKHGPVFLEKRVCPFVIFFLFVFLAQLDGPGISETSIS